MNMNTRLLLLLPILCALLLSAYPSQGFSVNKSPADYVERFVKGEDILWFGEVISARAFRNKKNETVIEWLCRYYELAGPVNVAAHVKAARNKTKRPAIRAKKNVKEQYFVATLRSPDMPLEVAKSGLTEIGKKKHYALRQAETSFVGRFEGKTAVYIGGGKGLIGNGFNVKFIDK